jgi:hypothetical protein
MVESLRRMFLPDVCEGRLARIVTMGAVERRCSNALRRARLSGAAARLDWPVGEHAAPLRR